jgi:pyruvyl transferase EpsO
VTDRTARFIAGLRSTLFSTLKTLLPIEPPMALVDVPNHGNVGDSAIFLGELAWMRHAGVPRPDYVCDKHGYKETELRARVPRGTILIHGGGNLGDLWVTHQRLRERVVAAFPDHRIVQLPQTIHFQSSEALDRAASVLSRHPNFTLLVRDPVSLEIAATGLGCRGILCPDSAFALDPIGRPARAVEDVIALVRTDKEAPNGRLPDGVVPVDWLEDRSTVGLRLERWLRDRAAGQFVRNWLIRRLADERVRRGYLLLSRGRMVVSDRLHAHILCLLMGIPHVLVDNNYGKVKSFREAWTKDAPGVRFCGHWSEAGTALSALRAELASRPAGKEAAAQHVSA